jgi:hypothetical protein
MDFFLWVVIPLVCGGIVFIIIWVGCVMKEVKDE